MCQIPFVVVLGLGKSGQAVALYCHSHNIPFVIVDDKAEMAKAWAKDRGFLCEVLDGQKELSFFDTLVPKTAWCVTSPGVGLGHPIILKCRSRNIEVISEVEFALRLVKDVPPKMIAITGTNGKTTVCELLCHIFKSAGKKCEAIGNIGRPVIDVLGQPRDLWPEWCIIEISSFQLETTFQQLFTMGGWLNVAPNHLDWHPSMDEYRRAKQRLSQLVVKDGLFVCHHSLPPLEFIPEARVIRYGRMGGDLTIEGQTILYKGKEVGRLPPSVSKGFPHDVDNYLAAFSLSVEAGIEPALIAESYQVFKKPHHRIEFVGEFNGVKYFDDSKGTNIAATAAAVAAVPGPVVLIAGGVHKGASYAYWKQAFSGKVRAIVAIGQARHIIASDVGDEIPVQFAQTLQEAVAKSTCAIPPPCSVVLSPGCSSFDMFRDYSERGDRFQQYVKLLARGRSE
jgi:UDP-N-acetylmuramoylalanine--D-glutamate ligase